MLVQAPNASHTNPYACTSSQKFKQLHMLGQPPNNSDTSLCRCRLLMLHTQILKLCRFPTIQRTTYACAGFQQFTCKSLCSYRFPTLHMHILLLVQVPDNSDNSLSLGSLLNF
ncbi:hypothetical protein O181_007955 [Austropuccinia psidii MF-1]|uniref:Uncharacterized protein n=1 Tax=Austropuccinia psidii MF-1 TaxID=1389203 RepID=A0A9Q3BP08_9BASI|nr:hypothetical protein [Austropuccinia psidii MF-1]